MSFGASSGRRGVADHPFEGELGAPVGRARIAHRFRNHDESRELEYRLATVATQDRGREGPIVRIAHLQNRALGNRFARARG